MNPIVLAALVGAMCQLGKDPATLPDPLTLEHRRRRPELRGLPPAKPYDPVAAAFYREKRRQTKALSRMLGHGAP